MTKSLIPFFFIINLSSIFLLVSLVVFLLFIVLHLNKTSSLPKTWSVSFWVTPDFKRRIDAIVLTQISTSLLMLPSHGIEKHAYGPPRCEAAQCEQSMAHLGQLTFSKVHNMDRRCMSLVKRKALYIWRGTPFILGILSSHFFLKEKKAPEVKTTSFGPLAPKGQKTMCFDPSRLI